MKKNIFRVLSVVSLAALLSLPGCDGAADRARPELKTVEDKASYTIGFNIGSDFVAQGMEIDPKILALGIEDAIGRVEPLLTDEQMNEAMVAFQEKMLVQQEERMRVIGAENLAAGSAFLAENKKKDGVVELASGLQYRVVAAGGGRVNPRLTDVVSVHYEGRLLDGTVFDSSLKRDQPATFPVNTVIPGLTEALQLMREGDKWEIFLPAALAYGEWGAPPAIPPNSVLIFVVELLKINP